MSNPRNLVASTYVSIIRQTRHDQFENIANCALGICIAVRYVAVYSVIFSYIYVNCNYKYLFKVSNLIQLIQFSQLLHSRLVMPM